MRLMKIASKVGLHLKQLDESAWKWKVKCSESIHTDSYSVLLSKKAAAIESLCGTYIISSTHNAWNKLHQRRKTSGFQKCLPLSFVETFLLATTATTKDSLNIIHKLQTSFRSGMNQLASYCHNMKIMLVRCSPPISQLAKHLVKTPKPRPRESCRPHGQW